MTDKTSSLIDHIITNDTQHKLQFGVILSDISDHYPIACKIDNFPILKSQEKSSYYRNKSNFIPEDYCEALEIRLTKFSDTYEQLNLNNFNFLFNGFVKIIAETTNQHTSLKKLSRKQLKLANKPWITKGIYISIEKKRKMF